MIVSVRSFYLDKDTSKKSLGTYDILCVYDVGTNRTTPRMQMEALKIPM